MRLNLGQPNPKQKEFLEAQEKYVAYGGSRGGGKSWAIRTKAILLALQYPKIRILFIRKTLGELKRNHIEQLKTLLKDIAVYKEMDRCFIFANGSRIEFGYLDSDSDIDLYQGIEYDVVMIDEATQFTEQQLLLLSASIRGVNDFPKRMYLTCNPGGVGHYYIKRLFIDRDFLNNENPDDYRFIKATLEDNKVLNESNPEYRRALLQLPPAQRKAWLEGDWDALAGAYFSEFRASNVAREPFEIPKCWNKYVSFDYGLDMAAVYWHAIDDKGNIYTYRELYEPNLIVSKLCKKVLKLSENEKIEAFIAPNDLANRNNVNGLSTAQIFKDNGINLALVSRERVAGWEKIHEWLNSNKYFITTNCQNLLRCFPLIQHSKSNPSDCATEPHELTHSLDSLRYFALYNPEKITIQDSDKQFYRNEVSSIW